MPIITIKIIRDATIDTTIFLHTSTKHPQLTILNIYLVSLQLICCLKDMSKLLHFKFNIIFCWVFSYFSIYYIYTFHYLKWGCNLWYLHNVKNFVGMRHVWFNILCKISECVTKVITGREGTLCHILICHGTDVG